jgi:H+-transporting ATPase
MNTEEKEEAAPARTTDAVADVEAGTGASQQRRQHAYSDLTGFIVPVERHRPPREDRRTVSDMVLMRTLPEEVVAGAAAGRRKKTTSSADVIQKFGYVPSLGYADLDLAEVIQHHGPRRERIASGLSDMVMVEAMEEKEEVEEFPINEKGLTSEEAAKLMEQYGKNELPEKVESKWLVFGRLLIQPMPCLIWVAVIIEAAIENFLDMGILLAILFINASISFYETNKAGNAIAALKNSLKPTATAKRDGKFVTMDATLLVPGDTVLLASGSAIPADCRINHGDIEVDQSALTGESLPVTFYKNDSCKMGSTVVRGEVEATVEFTGANTFFGKTASLLQENHEPSHLQKILMTIMKVLVGLSLTLCIINFIYLILNGETVKEALTFTIVLLVASIPLAIEIVTTTTLAIGSKKLVKSGAIVARLAAIEDLASMGILCSDKTGTLTLNKMVLQDETPVYKEGETQESVLVYAALAAKWKEPPRDALDTLTLGSVNMAHLDHYEQLEFLPFDPTIKRTEGTLKDLRTGDTFKTSKGAPHIIMKLLPPEGNDSVLEAIENDVVSLGARGIRSLAVAKTNADGVWEMMGLLTFLDPPRPDTKQTIMEAQEYGVAVKMITGDHLLIAKYTSEALSMGDLIFSAERLPMLDETTKEKPADLSKNYGDLCLAADGFAQVFPEHKYLIVECLRELGYTIGMTCDGVNDSPALKRADVGIAVAGSTDAARAAADIVLTQEGLSVIIHGIELAREIFSRMSNFITYRIAATLQLLLFFFIAIFIFHPSEYPQPDNIAEGQEWPEYFHMPVLMLMIITLVNDGTLITIAYDYAKASPLPTRWNLPVLFVVSSVLGIVSCVSSLGLLEMILNSWNPDGFWQKLGMDGLQYGQVTTAIYLKVSVSDILTLFSARTGEYFFWQIKPAPILTAGAVFALIVSSLLSIFWPTSEPDDIPTEGLQGEIGVFVFVWIYCFFFWLIQDLCKVLTYRYMFKTNALGIKSTGKVEIPDSTKQLIAEMNEAHGKTKDDKKDKLNGETIIEEETEDDVV